MNQTREEEEDFYDCQETFEQTDRQQTDRLDKEQTDRLDKEQTDRLECGSGSKEGTQSENDTGKATANNDNPKEQTDRLAGEQTDRQQGQGDRLQEDELKEKTHEKENDLETNFENVTEPKEQTDRLDGEQTDRLDGEQTDRLDGEQTDRLDGEQTDRQQTDRLDGEPNEQTKTQTEKEMFSESSFGSLEEVEDGEQTDRLTDEQTDSLTDEQTDRLGDEQTDSLTDELKESVVSETDREKEEETLREELEKELTEEERESRRQQSVSLKERGNAHFKDGDMPAAQSVYTEALSVCPLSVNRERSVLFSNRAAARIHMGQKELAISDCSKAITLNPSYTRPLVRRAELYEQTDRLDEALDDYNAVLMREPSNRQARQAAERLPPLIQERNEKLKEEMMSKLKDLGNLVLRPFGLSTNNFQLNQDPDTGSYSVNFVQKK